MEVVIEGFPSGQAVKNLPTNAGEMGLIPGWGRFPWGDWGGDGKQLQYSCGKSHGQRRLAVYSLWDLRVTTT